jgi:hypothetical protein
MPNWRYTLPLKDLLSDDENADFNAASVVIAPQAAERVRHLMKRVADDGHLYIELDEVADMFDDVLNVPVEVAQVAFNDAMKMLYDLSDIHRVWVK